MKKQILSEELFRMKRLAGIISESQYDEKINEVDENTTANLEKLAFQKLSNSPITDKLTNDILKNMSPEDIEQLKKQLSQLSEGSLHENDFSDFSNIVDTLQTSLTENDDKSSLKAKVGNLLSIFGKINANSLGTLPVFISGAMSSLGLTDDVLSRGEGALAMAATILGGIILWNLGDKLKGKEA